MKKLFIYLLIITFYSCIHQTTCEEDFSSNNHIEFDKFEFDHINITSNYSRAIVNKKKEEILLKGNLAGRLDDALLFGDIISKNKNENIVIVKRKNVVLRLKLICENEIGKMKIDTISK